MSEYDSINRRNTPVKRNRRKRRQLNLVMVVLIALIIGLLIAGALIWFFVIRPERNQNAKVPEVNTTEAPGEETDGSAEAADTESPADESASEGADAPVEAYTGTYEDAMAKAQLMAAQYDYQGAIDFIKGAVEGYEGDAQILKFITDCETKAAALVKWPDNTQITHIFFHTLIQDNQVVFTSDKKDQYNEVMTTISEFNEIMQEM